MKVKLAMRNRRSNSRRLSDLDRLLALFPTVRQTALTKKAPGEWAGGNIIDPKDGKIYKCKIRRHAPDGKDYKEETLEMRGEIGLGIGRSQYWKRTDLAEIEAAGFRLFRTHALLRENYFLEFRKP